MKSERLSDIKHELIQLENKEIVELCLRLVKFKKENKELLSYLLFEASDEQFFVQKAKKEMDEFFGEVNLSHPFYAKKGIRKILRIVDKNIRFSGVKTTGVELRMYFCEKFNSLKIKPNTILSNAYSRQVDKIQTTLLSLHEDLHFDYKDRLNDLKTKIKNGGKG